MNSRRAMGFKSLISLSVTAWVVALFGLTVSVSAHAKKPGACEAAFLGEVKAAKPLPPEPKLPGFSDSLSLQAYREYVTPNGLVLKPYFLRHIFHGDLEAGIVVIEGRKYRAVFSNGGMHTRVALADFLLKRPDVMRALNADASRTALHENGVLGVDLPQAAFNTPTSVTLKTFFPEYWKNAEVIAAIDNTYKFGYQEHGDPKSKGPPRRGDGQSYHMIGMHKGVKLKLVFRNFDQPQIITAYPLL